MSLVTDEQIETLSKGSTHRDSVKKALIAVIGDDAYDCIRVWEAWSVGTMTEDDFYPVVERIDEIVDAVIALSTPNPGDAA